MKTGQPQLVRRGVIVKATVHLADLVDFQAFDATFRSFWPSGHFPTRTMVQSPPRHQVRDRRHRRSSTSMKFARLGPVGHERPAALIHDRYVDLSTVVSDITATAIIEILSSRPNIDDLASLTADRFGPPLVGVGKIVCVGLNYREHAEESQMQASSNPPLFLKAADTIIGPHDSVMIPPGSEATDYEVELAVVIGKTARYLSDGDDPLDHVAGFTISNDVSEREFQLERGGQWDQGKNCETFNPLGPLIATTDEIDIENLELVCRVNGDLRQRASTSSMILPVADLIRYVTQFMTLYPGDIVNTGTPAGVALGFPDPKPYLRPGDAVELSIAGLGTQRQTMAPGPAPHPRT